MQSIHLEGAEESDDNRLEESVRRMVVVIRAKGKACDECRRSLRERAFFRGASDDKKQADVTFMPDLTDEVLARCDILARFSETPGRLTRTFLSQPMRQVHAAVAEWMQDAGMDGNDLSRLLLEAHRVLSFELDGYWVQYGGMSPEHILGVEWGTGRDIFAQLIFGLRISLVIATSATFITVAIGTVIGIIAGYTGGLTDTLIGRLLDLILAFPFLLIILALSGVLTQRLTELGVPSGNPSRILYLILVFSVFGWPYLARIVRGQVLSLREREFVEAAVAMGARRRRILFG
jgi:ABC-type dipeptide/oligopeptide/nickel transport system permease subunit